MNKEEEYWTAIKWCGRRLDTVVTKIAYLSFSLYFLLCYLMYIPIMFHMEIEYDPVLKIPQYAMGYLSIYFLYLFYKSHLRFIEYLKNR